jgi:hypothetical protein
VAAQRPVRDGVAVPECAQRCAPRQGRLASDRSASKTKITSNTAGDGA